MKGSLRKRGDAWYYSFEVGKIDGKRKRIERAAKGARTKSDAESIMRKAIADYESTGIVFKASDITLHDFLQLWMNEYVVVRLKANTQSNYRITIKNHILPMLGAYKIKALTPHALQQFMNTKVHEGLARQTLSIIKGILNKSLNHAVYPYEFIKENPMRYVELLKPLDRKPTKEVLKIQSKENLRLLQQLDEDHPFYLPFHIGLHCGLRVGELCGLEWKHINFVEGTIEIEQQLTLDTSNHWVVSVPKTPSSYRTIPVGRTLLDILEKARTKQLHERRAHAEKYVSHPHYDFVCRKPTGEHYTPAVIKYQTRELIKRKLGIPLNYHSLRHTHATMLIENGATIQAVQKRLGHSRSSVTADRYVHLTQKTARDTADLFDAITRDL